uniref:Uncharacterized protein n=1 Tax=Magallana gigas TaxID=29159 RepID=A0A8W8JED0_MAGGI
MERMDKDRPTFDAKKIAKGRNARKNLLRVDSEADRKFMESGEANKQVRQLKSQKISGELPNFPNRIRIEMDGRISESSIPDLYVCPWGNQEFLDKLPKLNTFQTIESDVYWFETIAGEQKQRCCAQQETGEPLNFYIATNAVHEAGDKILQSYVHEEGNWKLYETVCEVFSVKVEEMRKRKAQFPVQYALLSVTKGIHVEGATFSKPVRVQLPLENIENSIGEEDAEIEYMFFRIDGDIITHLKDQHLERLNDTIVTYVDKFSTYAGARRQRSKSFTSMEIAISLGIVYPCKLMTFMKKTSENYVQIWCEVVRKENWEILEEKRSHENKNLQKLDESESPEIFIKELERIRVDVQGNSKVAPGHPKQAMFLVFYPIAEGMHIFPPLHRNTGIHASPMTTVVYTKDTHEKKVLHTVTFNPWRLRQARR